MLRVIFFKRNPAIVKIYCVARIVVLIQLEKANLGTIFALACMLIVVLIN
jgi:hypothetical protein